MGEPGGWESLGVRGEPGGVRGEPGGVRGEPGGEGRAWGGEGRASLVWIYITGVYFLLLSGTLSQFQVNLFHVTPLHQQCTASTTSLNQIAPGMTFGFCNL